MNIIKKLLPFFRNMNIDKGIDEKIDSIWNESENLYSKQYINVKIEDLEKIFFDTLTIKETLENKARTALGSTGIYLTIFIGILTFVFNDGFRFFYFFMNIISLVISFYIIVNLLVTTIYSLKMIYEKNVIYKLNEAYYDSDSEEGRKDFIGQNIESNNYLNVIRNNYSSISYYSTINSLIAMILFMILLFVNGFLFSLEENNKIKDFYKKQEVKYEEIIKEKDNFITDLEEKIIELDYIIVDYEENNKDK